MNSDLAQLLRQVQAQQPRQQAAREDFVCFRAGRMHHDKVDGGPKLRIVPDRRRGQVALVRGPDGLVHFQWRNRATGSVEDDCPVFPGDATFAKIDTGREGDRVYQLSFASGRRMFFWMQEPKEDKDEEFANKVNEGIAHPERLQQPSEQESGSRQRRTGGGRGPPQGQIDPQQLAQLLGGGELQRMFGQQQGEQAAAQAHGGRAEAADETQGDEDDELQRALAMSIMEMEQQESASSATTAAAATTSTSTTSATGASASTASSSSSPSATTTTTTTTGNEGSSSSSSSSTEGGTQQGGDEGGEGSGGVGQ